MGSSVGTYLAFMANNKMNRTPRTGRYNRDQLYADSKLLIRTT